MGKITVVNDGLPEPLYQAILRDRYDPGHSQYTPSSLNAPVFQKRLMDDLPDGAMAEDASSRIWSLLGSSVHYVIENAGDRCEHYECERRFYGDLVTDRGTFRIGAQVDLLDHKNNALFDFKTTSAYSVKGETKPEYISQMNVQRWVVWKETGQVVENLTIVGILRDWSKHKRGGDYPKKQVANIPIPVWTMEETEAWIRDRVLRHEIAKEQDVNDMPPCSPAERWDRPSVYATMKKGRKSAVKLHDTQEAAEKMAEEKGKDHYVEYRPGERVRCQSYCPCADFCPHHQKYLEDLDKQKEPTDKEA